MQDDCVKAGQELGGHYQEFERLFRISELVDEFFFRILVQLPIRGSIDLAAWRIRQKKPAFIRGEAEPGEWRGLCASGAPLHSQKDRTQIRQPHDGSKRKFFLLFSSAKDYEEHESSQASGEKQGKARQTRHAAEKCRKFHIAGAENMLFRNDVGLMICSRAANCSQNIIFGENSECRRQKQAAYQSSQGKTIRKFSDGHIDQTGTQEPYANQ